MKNSIPLTLITVLLLAGAAGADIPDPFLSYVTMNPAAEGATVLVLPDGNGAGFTEARDPSGQIVDATITLHLLNSNLDPIVDFPFEDIWLETTGGGLAFCAGGTVADGSTDMNGETVWQNPLFAGGCTIDEGTQVMVAGLPIGPEPLDLAFVSPDADGDLDVDLTDIVTFAMALAAGGVCSDFNHDGVIDLSDIVVMSVGIGASCP